MDWFLGVVTFIASGAIGLVGLALIVLGLLGLIQGMHGGIVSAGIMIVFGAALLFIGVFGIRYACRAVRGQGMGPNSSEDKIAT